MLLLSLVVGLVIGAGVVGGAWWIDRGHSGAVPPTVPISLQTLPTTVLGQQRDDLALLTGKGTKEDGRRRQAMMLNWVDSYTDAYGGPGIAASYSGPDRGVNYQLVLVNGMQPAPPVTPDSVIKDLASITGAQYVAAPGTATVTCVAAPADLVTVDAHTSVAQARRTVLDEPQSTVTCVRSSRARNFSIELIGWQSHDTGGGSSASDLAHRMAAEVDRLWASVID